MWIDEYQRKRCDAATTRGICDFVLDEHENCPNMGQHIDHAQR